MDPILKFQPGAEFKTPKQMFPNAREIEILPDDNSFDISKGEAIIVSIATDKKIDSVVGDCIGLAADIEGDKVVVYGQVPKDVNFGTSHHHISLIGSDIKRNIHISII